MPKKSTSSRTNELRRRKHRNTLAAKKKALQKKLGKNIETEDKYHASFPEQEIWNLLTKFGIKFDDQHNFKDCRDEVVLRFDFVIFDSNNKPYGVIEYNGAQHYRAVKHFGGQAGFKKQQKHDKVKEKYCIENNLKILTIRYDDMIKKKILNCRWLLESKEKLIQI